MDDLGPNKGKATPKITSAEKSQIEQALRNEFLAEMQLQFQNLHESGEIKFIGDIPSDIQEQVWKEVCAKVFKDIVPLVPDSMHEALAEQFLSVKKEASFFDSDEEESFHFAGSNREKSESEESEEQSESEEESEEEHLSLFAKAKRTVGKMGGRVQSFFRPKKSELELDEDLESESSEEEYEENQSVKKPLVPPGPVTLISTRPFSESSATPSAEELFRISSKKKPQSVLKAVVSQPMPTSQAALDQIAIYREYFNHREDRGCEDDAQTQGLIITIHDSEKQYYITPSADLEHPSVDFIAEPNEDGKLDIELILKICEDAADAAIQEYEKHNTPKMNFDIPEDLPEDIRNLMQGIFFAKYQTCKGAFLVNSAPPVNSSATARRPSLGGSGDVEG